MGGPWGTWNIGREINALIILILLPVMFVTIFSFACCGTIWGKVRPVFWREMNLSSVVNISKNRVWVLKKPYKV